MIRDLPVRELCAINGRVPEFVVLAQIKEAFYHCGKSIIRSKLWQPGLHPKPDALPTYAEALIKHGNLDVDYDEMSAHLLNNEEKRLYDECWLCSTCLGCSKRSV